MITKKRFIKTLTATSAAIVLMMHFAACDTGQNIVSVGSGEELVIAETTSLTGLTIAEGATITAPEGRSLTMTVNHVETPIEPGSYEGDIVLTPAVDIIVNYNGMGTQQTYRYRAAIDIEDGKYMADKSVAAAVAGGTVTDSSATDVKITSVGEKFNGIIVRGDIESSYSIINPIIDLTGNGGNDFAGFGAAIMSDGNAEVTVENAKINNTGAVRTAVWVGGNSTMTVNNSEIEVHNGTLPEDYGWSWVRGGGGDSGDVMMEVPWMLGIVGNNRATNALGNGTAYYNNTHIKAQAWGALSTDACQDTKLNATNCHIETVESGYGSYGDGSANSYSGCKFDVKDYGLIITRGSGLFTDGTVVNSGRFGVMAHSGSSTVTVEKGCVFNTGKAVFQVKGCKPTIVVDNAELNSESGVILQAMVNDDPNKMVPRGGQMPDSGPPGGGMSGMPPGGMPEGGMPGMPGGSMPEGGMPGSGPGGAGDSGIVTATFKNVTLNGDIISSMTSLSDVVVNFENTTVTGAVTTSIAEHVVGPSGKRLVMQDETDLYYLIGEVKDTYAATDDEYGMRVSLDGNSTWIVDETSYLTSLTIADGATIIAPDGRSVSMTVNGVETAIGSGSYEGKIVLKVTAIS